MAHPRTVRALPVVLAGLTLVAGACGGPSSTAARAPTARAVRVASTSTAGLRTVTVDATGKTRAAPDQVAAVMAVHTSGPTAAGVLSDANARSRAVLDQIRAQGVDAKDVRTTQVDLGPTYDRKGRVTGFGADNQIEVTLRRLTIAGRQLDAVVRTAGDSARLESVTLGFQDDDKLLAAARVDGVRRAQAQAAQMVGALGADLGPVKTITEATSDFGTRAARSSEAASAADTAVPISPGTQELTVQVHVVFSIA